MIRTQTSGELGFGANRILCNLPEQELRQVRACAATVPLEHGQILLHPCELVRSVWFPLKGLVSLTAPLRSGDSAEAATVGIEGVIGVGGLLPPRTAVAQSIVQVAGKAVKIDLVRLGEILVNAPHLRQMLERFVSALIQQIVQGVSCNRAHDVESRFARWILIAHDRAGAEPTAPIRLTQEFIAVMLGVKRPTVSPVV